MAPPVCVRWSWRLTHGKRCNYVFIKKYCILNEELYRRLLSTNRLCFDKASANELFCFNHAFIVLLKATAWPGSREAYICLYWNDGLIQSIQFNAKQFYFFLVRDKEQKQCICYIIKQIVQSLLGLHLVMDTTVTSVPHILFRLGKVSLARVESGSNLHYSDWENSIRLDRGWTSLNRKRKDSLSLQWSHLQTSFSLLCFIWFFFNSKDKIHKVWLDKR